eukprot:315119-Prymnesium_polylepis.2
MASHILAARGERCAHHFNLSPLACMRSVMAPAIAVPMRLHPPMMVSSRAAAVASMPTSMADGIKCVAIRPKVVTPFSATGKPMVTKEIGWARTGLMSSSLMLGFGGGGGAGVPGVGYASALPYGPKPTSRG